MRECQEFIQQATPDDEVANEKRLSYVERGPSVTIKHTYCLTVKKRMWLSRVKEMCSKAYGSFEGLA